MSKTSKSIEVCNDIKTQIDCYKLLEKDGKQIYDKETPFEDDNPNYKVIQGKLFTIEGRIKFLLETLYYQSVEDNFYFFDCPLSVYKNSYEERLKFYFKYQIDAEEIDFLKEELSNLFNPCYSCRKITIDILTTVDYSRFYPNYSFFRITFQKKKEYLISKAKSLGWNYEELPDEMIKLSRDYYEERPVIGNFLKIKNQNVTENTIEESSRKNTKQLTSNQIVLLLDRIGFFMDAKIKNTSKINQAKIISLITSLNEKNIRTNINKLEKSQLQSSENYQKDIEIVDQYFDDL